ncbi:MULTISPECIES: restriction endonuclease subunit S [unclassified Bacteroides]|uniref:restriction endonuclease subunit S n=1 Tax=unclassified Bacteroides TaxID=2646097 RepID=UPI0018CC3CE0|nr:MULTISPECIES: restriction endonuclease subunit S [unclassified Bacteroides]
MKKMKNKATGLKKYKLGKLIELVEETNSDELFGPDDVRGISNLKEMMTTKADLNGRDLSKFQIVRPGTFVFNHRTSRNGSKFSITYNYDSRPHIFTEDYVAFRVKEDCDNLLMKEWLYMYFCRAEFDRFVITNSWGSSTEFYNWEDLCDIDITLPSIEQQRKYVDVYLALQNNLAAYQSKVEELKLVCDGYIEELRRKMKCEKIGNYIERYSEKNIDKAIDDVVGLSTEKRFRVAQSRVNRNELGGYKIVHPLDIAYVPTTDTWKVLAFAVNHFGKDVVISPIYEVFKTTGKLESDYLAIWLKRDEFDRYARYNSWGSARENFTFDEMKEVKIPIPDISVQREIVNIHKCYIERQRIAEALKEQLKNICPVLIRGSLSE